MHLLLTGATGLVGSGVLDAMLGIKEISKISILSRKPVKMAEDRADPRVSVILHKDFSVYPQEVIDQVRDARGIVWALGISQNQVNAKEYVEITKTYALEAARAFSTMLRDRPGQAPFNFVFVSGQGATTNPNPGFFTPTFSRVKGETEQALADLGAESEIKDTGKKQPAPFHTISIRPAFVDSSEHPAIRPYVEKTLMRHAWAGKVMRAFAPSMVSPTLPLGQFLTQSAMGELDEELYKEGKKRVELLEGRFEGKMRMPIVENNVIRQTMGLS